MTDVQMKGITCCSDCAYYSMKKHKCIRGCNEEGKATDHFYKDCTLPDVRPVVPCRDCQGSSCVSAPTDMLKCVILNRYVTPTEFCAWGHKCEDMRKVSDE